MLKLKLQYFGHLIQRTDSFQKTLMMGKIEGAHPVLRSTLQSSWTVGKEASEPVAGAWAVVLAEAVSGADRVTLQGP